MPRRERPPKSEVKITEALTPFAVPLSTKPATPESNPLHGVAARLTFNELITLAHATIEAATARDKASIVPIAAQVDAFCQLKRPSGRRSFLSARPTRAGLAVNVMVAHNPRIHRRVTRPREFDSVAFIGFLLMHLVGVTCAFHLLNKDRYYLRAEASRRAGEGRKGLRVFVSRIVLNALPGEDAPFAGDDHHSYRLVDLRAAKSRTYLPPSEFGREQAIKLAVDLFARTFPGGVDGVTAEGFGVLLYDVFAASDAFHGEE
jgi:hypothetical protein